MKEPLIKYARVIDGNRLTLFLGQVTTEGNPYQITIAQLEKQGIVAAKESKETMAGKMVPCISIPLAANVKNFEFKQNYKNNMTCVFVYLENEQGHYINLPTYL